MRQSPVRFQVGQEHEAFAIRWISNVRRRPRAGRRWGAPRGIHSIVAGALDLPFDAMISPDEAPVTAASVHDTQQSWTNQDRG